MPTRPSSSPPPVRGVFFDLDGTLVDHFDTLFRCYRDAFESLGLPVPDRNLVRRSVGGSMEVTMGKLVPDPKKRPAAAAAWRKRFSEIYLEDVKLMPGARWILEQLHARGIVLGVLTNKIGEHSRGICRHLGIAPLFAVVLGANDTPYRKPQRAYSEMALESLGTKAAETVLVGDSPYDVEAARHVGMLAPCVTTGTHTADELREAEADGVYPDLFAVGRAVFNLEPPAKAQ